MRLQFVEFGTENKQTILLLHGGGLSWWNYREAAQILAERYRVILPILDGHAGSDANFTTIEQNAAEIIAFVDNQLGGKALLMGGLSLGGQVLLEILAQRPDICEYAVVESALAVPSQLLRALIAPTFGSCYGLISKRWFAKLQFWSLGIKPDLFEEYYRDSCAITKENMIAFLQENAVYMLKSTLADCRAEVHIFVGEKENRAILRSARLIQAAIPNSKLRILPGLRHGDFSINCAARYAETVANIAEGRPVR